MLNLQEEKNIKIICKIIMKMIFMSIWYILKNENFP